MRLLLVKRRQPKLLICSSLMNCIDVAVFYIVARQQMVVIALYAYVHVIVIGIVPGADPEFGKRGHLAEKQLKTKKKKRSQQ